MVQITTRSMAAAQSKNAEAFLKNGSKAAAKALKRTAKHQPAVPVPHPVKKHRKMRQSRAELIANARADPRLVVREAVAKSKHETYYELVENTERKKKLEYQVTKIKEPPPGFTFIPVGSNPELTQKCKDLSRQKDVMMFVVSETGEEKADALADHTHRLGCHFRSTIVDEASADIDVTNWRRGGDNVLEFSAERNSFNRTVRYPLPKSQEELNAQVDAALRDLFPRIPNTDRQEIINHGFQLDKLFSRCVPVGLSEDLPLAKRVQMAAVAHIRHCHTRYDKLLKETNWETARKTIEPACLEVLVKWRGDEETGRDQMEEILREVVIISDSEDSDSEETADDEDDEMEEAELTQSRADPDVEKAGKQRTSVPTNQQTLSRPSQRKYISLLSSSPRANAGADPDVVRPHGTKKPNPETRDARLARRAERNKRKGFKRYQAYSEVRGRQQKEPEAFLDYHDQNARHGPVHGAGLHGHNPSDLPIYSGGSQRQITGQALNRQTPPRKETFFGGEIIDLTDSPYGKKVMSGPLIGGSSSHSLRPFEQREHHELPKQHTSLVRSHPHVSLRPRSPPKNGFQDYLLPSIEQASDRALEDRRNPSRQPEAAEGRRLEEEYYRDAHGVLRNGEGRRVICLDDNNREVPDNLESSRRFASNHGEGSATRTIPLAHSSMSSRHGSMAVDGRSYLRLATVHPPGQAGRDSYAGRPILSEGHPHGDLREMGGARYQTLHIQPDLAPRDHLISQSVTPFREPEVLRPRHGDDLGNHVRGPGESSHLIYPSTSSRFSEKNHGVAHVEQFSPSSSKLRESVVCGRNDFEEPVLISERKNGTIKYFQEPPIATRSYYKDPLPHHRLASTAHYGGASRRPVVEYTDLDRPMDDNRRNAMDRSTGRNAIADTYQMIPMDQVDRPVFGRPSLHRNIALPVRNGAGAHGHTY